MRGLQPNFQPQQQPNMSNNLMPRLPHQQGMNQTGNFPGNQVNQVVTGQRMPFASQGQNQQANQMGNQMIVNQSGPSPGGSMVVPSSGLSPFGCANSSGMTPPNSSAPVTVAQQQQNAQMLSNVNRPIMSPSNDFNPNIIHVVNNQNKQQQQNSMNSQAPSPFNQSQNVFNNNLMMNNNNNNNNNHQRMMPPTPGDLIPVPSPSPSLNSNGQPPSVSTPNTPNIVASLFNRPEPTPPPSMPIPSPSHAGAGKGQNFAGMNNNSMNAAAMMNNNNNNNSSSRSSLSSQRAALEAACKEEDSPPSNVHSPQNNNRGKLDQKLDSKMEMDDDKSDMGDIKIKTEDMDDHKMGSKAWIEAPEIKKEKNDGEDMKGREGSSSGGWDELKDIKREIKMEIDDDKRKIKEEAMSPASTSDGQAFVKTEMKLEPVANSTDKKKKCSKYNLFLTHFFVRILEILRIW